MVINYLEGIKYRYREPNISNLSVSRMVAYQKTTNVIESCDSIKQYFTVRKYVRNYEKLYLGWSPEDNTLRRLLENKIEVKFNKLRKKYVNKK